MVSTSTLIWISCRPLLRLMFCVTCGIAITKADVFPPVAAAGAGQILLNITLPCLMFSKIVPAFTSQNVNALGPLILLAFLYEAIGMALAYLIKQLFWVPHRFRYGILVTGGWGNVGDIPTAVVMSVTLFPLGGHKLVAWDFQGPDVEPEEVKEAMRLKRKALLLPLSSFWGKSRYRQPTGSDIADEVAEKTMTNGSEVIIHSAPQKHVSFIDDSSTAVPTDGVASATCSRTPTEINYRYRQSSPDRTERATREMVPNTAVSLSIYEVTEPDTLPSHAQHTTRMHATNTSQFHVPFSIFNLKVLSEFLKALLTPASITIFLAFLIALVPKLKALFIEVPGTHIPSAPDGQPPLAFILDSTSFVGAASVPLGLICLGSSLARLSWPRKGEWKKLPLGAISWIAIAKMVVMPVLGVLICEGLTNVGLISKDDKVLRFVCIFLSCLPTATVHVLLTQVYSGTGSSEHLAPFLIPQYVLMFISMTAITAYTIQLLF
ncbi:membrane transport protein-domain-containing protein [Gymnopilus junonius]|uniref:Membrane transport protein-domain-containing protein n=1 Tax=Gymnopilus junonius TaxID=109634 RepID=A0A9P5TLS7_GYMJU|nr:membrane transport protein-domain-containing protein [Gymnopilus junonius]